MKSNYRSRIAALAAEVVGSRRFAPPPEPFLVWGGEATPREALRAARQQRRAIVYVRQLSNVEAEIIVDNVPDYITWSTPQDCPMSVQKFRVNLITEELVGPQYTGWMRPESERTNATD